MSNNNFNDFFDEELKKQEEARQRQMGQQNQNPYGFGAQNAQNQQKHQQMYRIVPQYSGNSQQKFVQKNSSGKKAFLATLIAVGMVVTYFLGYFTFMFTNPDLKFIGDVLSLVENYGYVTEESDDKYAHDLAYQAANSMLKSIDQYSRLLTPEEYYSLLYPNEIVGVSNGLGYSINKDGEYYIAEVEIGSPAYTAGLFPGDVVIAMNIKENTDGVADGMYTISKNTDIEDFKKYIHSKYIEFNVRRDNVELAKKYSVRMGNYNGTAIEYYFNDTITNMSDAYKKRLLPGTVALPSDVAYIRISSFMDPNTMSDGNIKGHFAQVMDMFKQYGKKKLVLDLNENGGGRDDISAEIASYLLYDPSKPDGKDVLLGVDRDRDEKTFNELRVDSVYHNYFDVNSSEVQIVVLANGNSASASEMLLGAMLDYGTAVHVGTTTYGKGIGQVVITLKPATITVNGEQVESYWAAYICCLQV